MARSAWDKPRLLKKLKSLHKAGRDLSYNRMAKSHQSVVSAGAYHFGSYRKAVEQAGIDYAEVSRRPRWTRQAIIKLIKDARRKNQDLHWSAVSARGDELSRAAFASLQERLFGAWDKALQAAGLDADEISLYRHWDHDSILYNIRAMHREGEKMNSGSVQRSDPGLHAAAVRQFGRWDEALRLAGINVDAVRQRRRWSPEVVLTSLRAFKKKHGAVTDVIVREHEPALYGATMRQYGSIRAGAEELEKTRPTRRKTAK